jgi:uncharacterized protein with HEPN domain
MASKPVSVRLHNIVDAIDHIREVTAPTTFAAFESDWQKQWLVERGMQIITEASIHLPDDMKQRWPEIPWKDIRGLGNILRHDYTDVSPEILWKIAHEDMPALEQACKAELVRDLAAEPQPRRSIWDDDISKAERQVGDDGTPENSPDNTRKRKR